MKQPHITYGVELHNNRSNDLKSKHIWSSCETPVNDGVCLVCGPKLNISIRIKIKATMSVIVTVRITIVKPHNHVPRIGVYHNRQANGALPATVPNRMASSSQCAPSIHTCLHLLIRTKCWLNGHLTIYKLGQKSTQQPEYQPSGHIYTS